MTKKLGKRLRERFRERERNCFVARRMGENAQKCDGIILSKFRSSARDFEGQEGRGEREVGGGMRETNLGYISQPFYSMLEG